MMNIRNQGNFQRLYHVFSWTARSSDVAAKLAAAGHEVSAVARGATLAKIKTDDVVLRSANNVFSGRPLELESLLLVPMQFARAAELDTPCLDTIAALAVLQAQDEGLYTPC